ncbi:MAG: T9SS type A sorting domain-containing protein [Paludibacter sp.]|nr:T9SS type A sorting domain-containing protein [Paludibacter sp.]
MKRNSFLLTIIVSACFFSAPESFSQPRPDVVWKEINGVMMPLPPPVHPRLYLRREQVADLSVRINDSDLAKVWGDLQKMKIDKTSAEIPATKDWRFYFDTKGLLNRAEMKAMDYLMTSNAQTGREAITMIIDTLETAVYPNISDISRAIGRLMVTGAIVYDWCYPQLTAGEKTRFINAFIRLAGMLECGYPPVRGNSVVGHVSEWMLMRDLLSTGVAIYDEYPEMYHLSAGRFFSEHLPVRNWFYPAEAYHQGMSYLNVRLSNDLFALWILDRMGAGNVYHPSQQYVLYDMIYKRRPDGQIMAGGDVNYSRTNITKYPLATLLAGSYYKNPYINYEFRKDPRMPDNQAKLFDFLWRDTKLTTKSPVDLPLTRYSGFPYGWMIARTGWGTESVIAEMKINEYNFVNHQHNDAGAFQIYYKGPLAIDAGMYEGSSGGYNSPHNKNFFKRTIAHNSLLIYDPGEKFPASAYGGEDKSDYVTNDGGQRLPGINWGPPANLNDMLTGNFKTGQVLASGFGTDSLAPDYSYLKGDITQAYSSKVKEVKRSFVFLNLKETPIPAVLIVFDKVVASKPEFKKYWLLHSIEEPLITGNTITIRRTLNGDSGKLVNTVLLPEISNAGIVPVGGPGKEFWVFGTNYPNEPADGKDEANERGAWRVEISPKKAVAEDYYLNVMQMMANNQNNMYEVKYLDGDKVIGVQIADRITTFSKNSLPVKSSFSVQASGTGTFKFVLTDLTPGTWEVTKDSLPYLSDHTVKAKDGILAFEGTEGTYKMINLSDTSSGEITNDDHSGLKLYPNPASKLLNIDLSGYENQQAEITVFTGEGKIITKMTASLNEINQTQYVINIDRYPAGIFLVALSTEKFVKFGRFIKQ